MIKLLILILSAVLNWWGGKSWHNARRFLMSGLIAGFIAYHFKTWWLFPVVMIPFAICLSLTDHNRGWWCFFDALSASAILFFLGHIKLTLLLIYCIGNAAIGKILNKTINNQLIEDLSEGALLATLIFFI